MFPCFFWTGGNERIPFWGVWKGLASVDSPSLHQNRKKYARTSGVADKGESFAKKSFGASHQKGKIPLVLEVDC